MSDWISVEDKLPVGDHDVLVVDMEGGFSVAYLHLQKKKWVPISCDEAVSDHGSYLFLFGITHWMPLPEPPETKQ